MSASRVGPYEVVRELGRGGMGVVLEARHPDLPGRRLALKLLSRDAADGAALERFSREARLLARVKHPNVVGVHAFASSEDGLPYLVTDLVEGANLKQVARSAPIAPARAATIVRTLASAVSTLHAAGILHRDLKPENVILQADDAPVLLDFGLAREQDAQRLTQTGTLLGTPAYMSPEQAGGDPPDTIDARCDVYGLGAILFELLAGRPPFEGTPIQIVTAVLRREPRWPSEDRADVPADLEAVLQKAMAKEPAERYASAAELGRDLARFAGGERVAAPRPRARGSRRLVALAIAVAVSAGGAAVVLKHRAPVTPAPDTAAVSTARRRPLPEARRPAPVATFGPEPPSDPQAPVATYRERLRWLDDPANAKHPRRKTVEALLAMSRDRPLLSVACPDAERSQVFARFVSDAQVATLCNSTVVHVLDVERGRALVPRWSTNNVRLWNLVSTPSLVVVAGAREVCYARRDAAPSAASEPEPMRAFATFPSDGELPGTEQGALRALAASPDGTRAVVGGEWPFAILYDLTADPPTELRRLEGFTKSLSVAAFSADGSRLLLGTIGGENTGQLSELSLWSADGEPLGGETGHLASVDGTIASIEVSRDNGFFLVGSRYGAAHLQPGPAPDALSLEPLVLALDPETKQPTTFPWLALGRGPEPRLYGLTLLLPSRLSEWRLTGGVPQLTAERERGQRLAHSIALSPDGTLLAVGGVLDGGEHGVELWAAQGR